MKLCTKVLALVVALSLLSVSGVAQAAKGNGANAAGKGAGKEGKHGLAGTVVSSDASSVTITTGGKKNAGGQIKVVVGASTTVKIDGQVSSADKLTSGQRVKITGATKDGDTASSIEATAGKGAGKAGGKKGKKAA